MDALALVAVAFALAVVAVRVGILLAPRIARWTEREDGTPGDDG